MLFVWIGKKGSETESEPDQPFQPRFVFPITFRLLVGSLFSTLALVKMGAEQITGNYLSGLFVSSTSRGPWASPCAPPSEN